MAITSVRRELVSKAVLYCLEIMEIDSYPVNPRRLASGIWKNSGGAIPLVLEEYSAYAGHIGATVDDLIKHKFKSQEGATIYFKKDNLHIIFYNDQIEVPGRINWTIAHELGHVLLHHHKFLDPLNANKTTADIEYGMLETEADLFAGHLLCHPLVIMNCTGATIQEISNSCRISMDAAKNRLLSNKRIKSLSIFNKWDDKILMRMSSYAFARKCGGCNKIFVQKGARYCPICAGQSLKWYNGADSLYQKDYGAYAPSACAKCGAPLASPQCNACGHDNANHCSSIKCSIDLPDDARYCFSCGAKSTYNINRHIPLWRTNR